MQKLVQHIPSDTKPSASRSLHSMLLVGKHLWCGCEDGSIVIWDTETSTGITHWQAHSSCAIKQMVVVHTREGKTVWTTSPVERSIHVWDTQPPYTKLSTIHSPNHTVNCLAQHQDNVWVGGNGDLNVYSSATYQLRGSWRAHDSSVTSILSLGNRVWTGSAAGEIRVWEDASELQILLIKELGVHCAKILGLCKYQTQHVWTCALDKSIVIWDIKTLSPKQEIVESKDSMGILLRDGNSILGAADKTVYIWRFLSATEPAPEEEEILNGRYSPRTPRTVLSVRIGERDSGPTPPRRRTFIGSSRDVNRASP